MRLLASAGVFEEKEGDCAESRRGRELRRGIVLDQPNVAERARKRIAESDLAARCQAAGGDFFKEVPSGADAYILKHVIHDWSDDLALTILRNCRSAMGPNGKLLIVEGTYPAHIDQSTETRVATTSDVNKLVNTGGRTRSKAEFQSLFERAGFELTRIVPTQPGTALGGQRDRRSTSTRHFARD